MRERVIWAGCGLLLILLLWSLSDRRGGAGSTVSYGALGWRGLAAVVEQLGVDSERLTEWPAAEEELSLDAGGTLFVAFPWSRWGPGHAAQLVGFVRRGGTLVLGYGGSALDPQLLDVLDELGLAPRSIDDDPPLAPWQWLRRRSLAEHPWTSPPSQAGTDPLVTARLGFVVPPPRGSEPWVLARADGQALLSRYAFGAGTIWLLPATTLANAYLHRPGNAAFLLDRLEDLPRPFVFDELHHGLGSPAASDTEASSFLDRMVLQLLGLYVLALLAFAWRFGPPWPPRPPRFDSHREFLLGLGALHDRLDHRREAATRLVERLGAYAPARYDDARLRELRELAETRPLLEVAQRAHEPTGGSPT